VAFLEMTDLFLVFVELVSVVLILLSVNFVDTVLVNECLHAGMTKATVCPNDIAITADR